MSHFQGRHPECKDCKHFRPHTGSVHCLNCDAGEFFEEKINDQQPSDQELLNYYYFSMEREDDDQ